MNRYNATSVEKHRKTSFQNANIKDNGKAEYNMISLHHDKINKVMQANI